MARKRRHSVGELEDVNLVPIMSILVILIPMLIYAFTFFEVTVQSVAAPKMGTGKAKEDSQDEKKPLNLTVIVKKDGFLLKYDEEVMTGEGETELKKREFPPNEQHPEAYWDYDYPRLYNRLAAIKEQFPDEKTLNIGAEMNIPWSTLARTIDCARVKLKGGPFEGDDAGLEYGKAGVVKIKDEEELLFPHVVFVVAE